MPRTVSEPDRTDTGGSALVAVDGRTFPLRGAQLDACAGGGIARTTLRQSYENPYDEPLEVIYTMPLPADGAVVGYTMIVGETKIVGEIEARKKAEEAYRKALQEGRTGGLLEQDRADTFTQRLGNVPPRMPIEVEIDVLHPVAFHARTESAAAEWEYRFPTVVGVRHEGGPGRVPDREKLDAPRADGQGTPARLTFHLLVSDGLPEGIPVRSPSHKIICSVSQAGPGTRVSLDEPSPLNRDVTVCWAGATPVVGVHLIEGPGLAGDDGRYGLLTIVPPAAPVETFRRDLTLLVDASGSMSGLPLESARKLGVRLLQSLQPEDRFEISIFSDTVRPLVAGLLPATPTNVRSAIGALRKVTAGGSTEMAEAIKAVLKPLRDEAQRQVVVFTDGQIGFEQEIVHHVLQGLLQDARLHMVGIGSSPNRSLTRSASRAGRGTELILTTPEDVEVVAASLLKATVAPVLTEVTVEGAGVLAVAPERPRDLFEGRPVILGLALNPEGGEVLVRGRLMGSSKPWVRRVAVTSAADAVGGNAATVEGERVGTDLPLGAFFGREAIEDEEMRLAGAKNGRAIAERIEVLGLRHRLPSRMTSLVAIAESPSVDPRLPRRRERLVVDLPEGVSAEGVGLAMGMFRGGAMVLQRIHGGLDENSPGFHIEERTLGVPKYTRSRVGLRRQPGKPGGPVTGRIIHADYRPHEFLVSVLVFEFECPYDGYDHPGPGTVVEVHTGCGEAVRAVVEEDQSTYPGRQTRGLILRMHLRFRQPVPVRHGDRLVVKVSDLAIIEMEVELSGR
jgi:Ca-activated chloride channel homolog